MIMLDDLKVILDEIEKENEWAHWFVLAMLYKKSQDQKLNSKEFERLNNIHQKYMKKRARSLG